MAQSWKEKHDNFKVTFNGHDLTSIIRITQDLKRPVIPNREDNVEAFPGSPGSRFYGTRYSTRTIKVPFVIRIDTINQGNEVYHKELIQKQKQLAKWLDVTEPKTLSFSDEPDVYYVAMPSGNLELDEKNWRATGSIEFICYEPYKVANATDLPKKYENHYEYDKKGNVSHTMASGMKKGSAYGSDTGGVLLTINNRGDVAVPIHFDFITKAPYKFLQFHNQTTEQTFQFGVTPDSNYKVQCKNDYKIYPPDGIPSTFGQANAIDVTNNHDPKDSWMVGNAPIVFRGRLHRSNITGKLNTYYDDGGVSDSKKWKKSNDARWYQAEYPDNKKRKNKYKIGFHRNKDVGYDGRWHQNMAVDQSGALGISGESCYITGNLKRHPAGNQDFVTIGSYTSTQREDAKKITAYLDPTDDQTGTYVVVHPGKYPTGKKDKNGKEIYKNWKAKDITHQKHHAQKYHGSYILYDKDGKAAKALGSHIVQNNQHYTKITKNSKLETPNDYWDYKVKVTSDFEGGNIQGKTAYYGVMPNKDEDGQHDITTDGKKLGDLWKKGWIGCAFAHQLKSHGVLIGATQPYDAEKYYIRDFDIRYVIDFDVPNGKTGINSFSLLGPNGGHHLNVKFTKTDTKSNKVNMYFYVDNGIKDSITNTAALNKKNIHVRIERYHTYNTNGTDNYKNGNYILSIDCDGYTYSRTFNESNESDVVSACVFYIGARPLAKPGKDNSQNLSPWNTEGIETTISKLKDKRNAVAKAGYGKDKAAKYADQTKAEKAAGKKRTVTSKAVKYKYHTKAELDAALKKIDVEIAKNQALNSLPNPTTDVTNTVKSLQIVSKGEESLVSLPPIFSQNEHVIIDGTSASVSAKLSSAENSNGANIYDVVDIGSDIIMAQPGANFINVITDNGTTDGKPYSPPETYISIIEKYL